MRLDMYIIGIVFFGIFIFIGVNLYGAAINDYDIESDNTKFQALNDKVAKVATENKDLKDRITGKVDESDTESSMFAGGFRGVRGVIDTMDIAGEISESVVEEISLGDSEGRNIMGNLSNYFVVIIGVLTVFTVLAYIFRFQPR